MLMLKATLLAKHVETFSKRKYRTSPWWLKNVGFDIVFIEVSSFHPFSKGGKPTIPYKIIIGFMMA